MLSCDVVDGLFRLVLFQQLMTIDVHISPAPISGNSLVVIVVVAVAVNTCWLMRHLHQHIIIRTNY